MRCFLVVLLLSSAPAFAQDAEAFARAMKSGKVQRLDRWVERELHRMRKGHVLVTPSTTYITHGPTLDTLVAFLRRQPGVSDAAWDGGMNKQMIWPGHSRIGLRFTMNGTEQERCYSVQEGIPGVIRLPGWHPHVRKDREDLKYLGAEECLGFAEEQRLYCEQRGRPVVP
ncbi:MAG: hypothetical protein JNJ64_13225 [Flavobacteriales bacterium]|nr:hypothetical protein [Flavobacteriales bacterium]